MNRPEDDPRPAAPPEQRHERTAESEDPPPGAPPPLSARLQEVNERSTDTRWLW